MGWDGMAGECDGMGWVLKRWLVPSLLRPVAMPAT